MGNFLGLEFVNFVILGIILVSECIIDVNIFVGNIKVNVLQIDVVINFGNLGGVLVDINGNFVGINFMKIVVV